MNSNSKKTASFRTSVSEFLQSPFHSKQVLQFHLKFPEQLADEDDDIGLGNEARVEKHLNTQRKPGRSQDGHYSESHSPQISCFVRLWKSAAKLQG